MSEMSPDLRVCHQCLGDIPKPEAVCIHVHFSNPDTPWHSQDEDYFYHLECYEGNVRLHG